MSGNVWYDGPKSVWVYRASGLGNCVRSLEAERRGMDGKDWPEDFKRRFADGNLHEGAVLAALADHLTLFDLQAEVELPVLPNVVIRGHHDGMAVGEPKDWLEAIDVQLSGSGPVSAVVEVKALADSGWKKFDKHGLRHDDYYRYAVQLSVYMAAQGTPGVMCVKNKNSGQMAYEWWDEPPIPLATIRKRVAQVEAGVRRPDFSPCDRKDFPCLFDFLHEDLAKAVPADVPEGVDLRMVAVHAAEYDEWRDKEGKAKEGKLAAREQLLRLANNEHTNLETEDYRVSVYDGPSRFNWERFREDYPDYDATKYQDPGGLAVRVSKKRAKKGAKDGE